MPRLTDLRETCGSMQAKIVRESSPPDREIPKAGESQVCNFTARPKAVSTRSRNSPSDFAGSVFVSAKRQYLSITNWSVRWLYSSQAAAGTFLIPEYSVSSQIN